MSDLENSPQDQKRTYLCMDCGKGFLRSEHLSRHRLNHRPKQVFSCTRCPKEFVRSDLLQRHAKRHEKGMHYRSTGGVVRAKVKQDITICQEGETVVLSNSQPLSLADDLYPTMDESHSLIPDQDELNQTLPVLNNNQGNMLGPSLRYAEFGLEKVNPLFFDNTTDLQDIPTDLEWFFEDVLQNTPSAHESEGISEPVFYPFLQHEDFNADSPSENSPWFAISIDLRKNLAGLSSHVLDSPWFRPKNLADFYELYFNNYHPHFPVFHRPTMIPSEIPPLLLMAIVTLGSTLSSDASLFSITTQIHEYFRWTVCGSKMFQPPAPLWCLQALLLIQAHGKMFSSRKHHELAHIFHGAIITLMRRGSAYTSARLAERERATSLERAWHQWIENESSRRTAYFAFVMDAQHSSLFGHTPTLSVSDIRLSLPCPDAHWEATTSERWAELDKKGKEPLYFLPVLRSLLRKQPVPSTCSAYARFILLHGLYSITFHLQAKDSSTLGVGTRRGTIADAATMTVAEDWRDIMDRAIDTWSFSLLSQTSSLCLDAARPLYRMAHIAIYTSIIDIHIIAGAPSLLGNLLSPNDKSKASIRVRAWSERPEAKKALHHALLLVQETLFTGHKYRAAEDNISLRPWCLYHATLVIWAFGFVTEAKADPVESIGAEEYLVRMRTAMAGGAVVNSEFKGANRTNGLVMVVRECFESCRWELLKEAYDVLGRLGT
ncbi:hypothetical protein BP5796_03859 [Coleophoma crateriformis]|uniref:C2H2-type domain-containing protein n=1 Tax=Coleophoma crateriformis TaxID=565419 RepID=A0A3D8SHA4_9HELO|nr:hypothetical protein BP5796_03859 [Coleophoma crateriformis]